MSGTEVCWLGHSRFEKGRRVEDPDDHIGGGREGVVKPYALGRASNNISPCDDIQFPQFAPRSAYGIFYMLSLDTRAQKVCKFLTLYFLT